MSDDQFKCGSLKPNLLELSTDLYVLFRKSINSDFSICVNNESIISCHRDILKYRSAWFMAQIKEAETRKVTQIAITENPKVLEAVLFYLYTGNLELIESLNIPLLDLYEAAKRYGLARLEKIIQRIAEENHVKEITNSANFQWNINFVDYNSLTAESFVLDGFTVFGNDKWEIKIHPIPQPDDLESRIGIYIVRQTAESNKTSHAVTLTIYIYDADRNPQLHYSNGNTFYEDGEYLLCEFLTLSDAKEIAKRSIPGSMLILSCKLSVCAKVGYSKKFCLQGAHRKHVNNELTELSLAMYKLSKQAGNHDLKIEASPSKKVNIHSYICIVRCRIPAPKLHFLGLKARLGIFGWTSFVTFLYTGQPRYLEGHGRDIFCALHKTGFVEAKRKYSGYLSKNLNLENAFHVLCDASKCNDQRLLNTAAEFLAKRSYTITDQKIWIRIACDRINSLAEFLPELHIYKIHN